MSDTPGGEGWEHGCDGKWYAPGVLSRAGWTLADDGLYYRVPPMATIESKRAILQNLRRAGKYDKPFRQGNLAALNVLGGDWNDYAQVVFSMMTVDTLLNIEASLKRLEDRLGNPPSGGSAH